MRLIRSNGYKRVDARKQSITDISYELEPGQSSVTFCRCGSDTHSVVKYLCGE